MIKSVCSGYRARAFAVATACLTASFVPDAEEVPTRWSPLFCPWLLRDSNLRPPFVGCPHWSFLSSPVRCICSSSEQLRAPSLVPQRLPTSSSPSPCIQREMRDSPVGFVRLGRPRCFPPRDCCSMLWRQFLIGAQGSGQVISLLLD